MLKKETAGRNETGKIVDFPRKNGASNAITNRNGLRPEGRFWKGYAASLQVRLRRCSSTT
jgi:hypothetical protein